MLTHIHPAPTCGSGPVQLPLATGACLAALHEQVATSERLLRATDPSTPVATCGSRNVHDLGTHLGRVYRWVYRVAAAVVHTAEPCRKQFAPLDGEHIADWHAQGAATLPAALKEADPAAPGWAFDLEGAVTASWFRRLAQDTAVHLVDAQLATSAEVHVDAVLTTDGVDEVFAAVVPRVWRGGEPKPLPAPVVLRTTDTGHDWLIQPADVPRARPVDSTPSAATAEATAAELLLTLWKRHRANPEWISGDIAAANALLTAPLPLCPDWTTSRSRA